MLLAKNSQTKEDGLLIPRHPAPPPEEVLKSTFSGGLWIAGLLSSNVPIKREINRFLEIDAGLVQSASEATTIRATCAGMDAKARVSCSWYVHLPIRWDVSAASSAFKLYMANYGPWAFSGLRCNKIDHWLKGFHVTQENSHLAELAGNNRKQAPLLLRKTTLAPQSLSATTFLPT